MGTLIAFVLATAAVAHDNVQNPAVQARMDSMVNIADSMKQLGQMWRGAAPFDVDAARTAAAAIAAEAAATPDLFAAREDDPKSEARPEIWTAFDDFTAKSAQLRDLAHNLSQSLADESDLDAGMKALSGACRSCHAVYRE